MCPNCGARHNIEIHFLIDELATISCRNCHYAGFLEKDISARLPREIFTIEGMKYDATNILISDKPRTYHITGLSEQTKTEITISILTTKLKD